MTAGLPVCVMHHEHVRSCNDRLHFSDYTADRWPKAVSPIS